VDLGTLEGVRRTVSPAGLVRTQRLLRAQWTEAALMATATRHNSLLLDSARRVRLRRRAALCLGVQRKLGARFTNEAKMAAQRAGTAVATGNASKSSAGKPVVTAGDDSNFFLTAMRHSITFSPDDDPYAIPTPTPLTTLLIQVRTPHFTSLTFTSLERACLKHSQSSDCHSSLGLCIPDVGEAQRLADGGAA
jgi:hypothetical protein